MVILSLFDGMSCGQIALNRIGLKPTKYYASEIDKYAIKVTQANYPDTIQLGNVTNWREWGIDWSSIDLLMGGSPCQGFSFAGKQLAFDDPRSALFFVYVDILNHIKNVNPRVKFLLENVKMKKEYLAVISSYLGVEPVFINSALVSAQNRQRYYWCNWFVNQPIDKGVLLADILETGVTKDDKSYALTARYFKAGNFNRYATKHSDQLIFELFGLSDKCIAKFKRNNVKFITHDTPIAKPLTAGDYSKLGKYGNYLQSLIGLSEIQYRKLTLIECERLQTVADNYTNHVSNTQRYKMLGNGWTVDVIAHLLTLMYIDIIVCQ
jgi:site-specific DNA-cytosine methylase